MNGAAGWPRALARGAEAIGVALFAAMFATFIAGVVLRYAGMPLTWSDEVSGVLMIWCTFWATAFVVRLDEHVTFDLLYNLAPPRGRRVIALAASLALAALLLATLPATYGYVAFLTREVTPTLRLRLDYVFACYVIFLAVVAVRFVWQGRRLAGRGWERWV